MILDESYWTEKYKNDQTGWDIGYPSTPLKEYIDQLTNKDLKILIPGAGNAYEAEYLWHLGFYNIYVVDLSIEPLNRLKERVPSLSDSSLIHGDFFELKDTYDLVLEQTFFCALNPTLRQDYVEKMVSILKPNGKLVGLLFNIPLYEDHPPFGGNKSQYEPLFQKQFDIKIMETAYNSIPPRINNELFIKMTPLKS